MRPAHAAAVLMLLGISGALAQPGRPAAPAAKQAAPATVPATPQQTTATFGDWTLRCAQPAGAAKVCEVVQLVQQDGKPVAEMALGMPAKGRPMALTVLLPVNVGFGAAPSLQPAGGEGANVPLAWRRCLPGGCIAESEIGEEVLARMRGWSQPGRIAYTNGTGRPVLLPVSPLGLPQALDALAKENAG